MSQWQLLSERFNQLQHREKVLIWGGSLILTLWLGVVYLLEPGWQSMDKAKMQLDATQRQQQQTQQQSEELRQQLSTDIDRDYRERLAVLQQQQVQLNEQIKLSASHFIGAEQMVTLLQNMLQSSQGVQLASLQTLPPVPVRLDGQAETEPTLMYQHTIKLVMTSDYAKLYQVLQRIEQLPWLVSWQGLQYRVTEYPLADMTIELGTVSENEDFIRL
ncbi:MAG TPA: hypothetical protein VIN66_11065 [Rheinheimera sp.]|uniref:hypothetical protein n=1 Tax=Rheinheimera sp. TaxID=1869214 RepID=UPI002F9273D4